MSMMCKMSARCCSTKGLCLHEKMMMTMVVAVVATAPVVAHFVFHWF
jgi:hypothetical protein